MDPAIIKELATLPPVAVLVVVIFLQMRQIEKLTDSIIRMQDEYARNFGVLISGIRGLFPDKIDPSKGSPPPAGS